MKSLLFAGVAGLVLTGCCCYQNPARDPQFCAPITCQKISQPIQLDGKLDDPAWAEAAEYNLIVCDRLSDKPPLEQQLIMGDVFEKATVKIAHDDDYIYVGACLEDHDVVQTTEEEQQHSYKTGDVLEVFLWPDQFPFYWEIYSTPNSKRTVFFFPAGGYPKGGVLSSTELPPGLEAASQIQGSLNDSSDRDEGWSTEMRISKAELAKQGVKFEPGQSWRCLIARYNYSKKFYLEQNSTYPQLPQFNYHIRGYYAPVIFK